MAVVMRQAGPRAVIPTERSERRDLAVAVAVVCSIRPSTMPFDGLGAVSQGAGQKGFLFFDDISPAAEEPDDAAVA